MWPRRAARSGPATGAPGRAATPAVTPRGVEGAGEGGPVEEGDAVGEQSADIACPLGLAGAGVQFAQRVCSAASSSAARSAATAGGAPSSSSRSSATVGNRSRAARNGPSSCPSAVAARRLSPPCYEVADQRLGEDPGRLVRVGGAAVEVQVAVRVRAADLDHHVERVVRPEVAAGRPDGDDRACARRAPEGTSTPPPAATRRGVLPLPAGRRPAARCRAAPGARAHPAPRCWYGLRGSSAAVPMRTWRASRSWWAARGAGRAARRGGGRRRRRGAARCR